MLEILLLVVALVLLWIWGSELLRLVAWLATGVTVWSLVDGTWPTVLVAGCVSATAWLAGHVLHRWRHGYWRSVLLAAAFDDLAADDDDSDGTGLHGPRRHDVPKPRRPNDRRRSRGRSRPNRTVR